jgi:hypothetical protein
MSAEVQSVATWCAADLWRPRLAIPVVGAALGTTALAFVFSCNVHEIAHAAVGTAFGWEVDRISLCLPDGGAVHYRSSLARGDTVESWSGGLGGAASLISAYVGLIARKARPLRQPLLWAAGFGLLLPVGPQVLIAALEGTSGAADYTESISDSPILWGSALVVAMSLGPVAHWSMWRRALRHDSATRSQTACED